MIKEDRNIIWIIGKTIEVDIFWGFSNFKHINNLEEVYNNNLFDQENYKYILKKTDASFFKKKINIDCKILIKGAEKEPATMDNYLIYNLDTLSVTESIKIFIEFYNLSFLEEELIFINKFCTSLSDLININYLKSFEISIDKWNIILNQPVYTNWYELFKNNELIPKAILNEPDVIPVLQFLNKCYYEKKYFTQFLSASIKSGDKIWEYNGVWKKLI